MRLKVNKWNLHCNDKSVSKCYQKHTAENRDKAKQKMQNESKTFYRAKYSEIIEPMRRIVNEERTEHANNRMGYFHLQRTCSHFESITSFLSSSLWHSKWIRYRLCRIFISLFAGIPFVSRQDADENVYGRDQKTISFHCDNLNESHREVSFWEQFFCACLLFHFPIATLVNCYRSESFICFHCRILLFFAFKFYYIPTATKENETQEKWRDTMNWEIH